MARLLAHERRHLRPHSSAILSPWLMRSNDALRRGGCRVHDRMVPSANVERSYPLLKVPYIAAWKEGMGSTRAFRFHHRKGTVHHLSFQEGWVRMDLPLHWGWNFREAGSERARLVSESGSTRNLLDPPNATGAVDGWWVWIDRRQVQNTSDRAHEPHADSTHHHRPGGTRKRWPRLP